MHSCIYEGEVYHRRREPVTHQFRYRLFMVYLDLDEVAELVGQRRLIADTKSSLISFLRRDHLADPSISLQQELRQIIVGQTGCAPRGPVRLLTQLRYFGYYFSPLNLFYFFDERDQQVEYVLAEVSNTPWKERHFYTLWNGNRTPSTKALEFSHPKAFHVSPFMDMDLEYRWRLQQPAATMQVQLSNMQADREVFQAGMALRRRELNALQLRRMTLRYPLMTARIGVAIYLQALQLWWKKCPFYTHPKKRKLAPSPHPHT